jgi:hypothetical protein
MPWTQWSFSAAEPHSVFPRGELQRLQAVAVRLRTNGRFDPRWMLRGHLSQHGEILAKTALSGRAFSLYTRHGIRLAMLGSVPVGAWVPFPGSAVTLASERSEFFADNLNSRIVERYPGTIGVHPVPNRKGLWSSEPQYFPLGDFLGPNVVVWSEDPGTRIIGTPFERPSRPGVVTAFLIGDTNFSTRIAVAPVSLEGIEDMADFAQQNPRSAREDLYAQDVPEGVISLTVERALNEEEYADLKRRVAAQPVTWVPIRYPPGKTRAQAG